MTDDRTYLPAFWGLPHQLHDIGVQAQGQVVLHPAESSKVVITEQGDRARERAPSITARSAMSTPRLSLIRRPA